MTASWPRALIDFFFPPRCPFCGGGREEGHRFGVCPVCLQGIRRPSGPRCPRCGLAYAGECGDDHFCSACLREEGHFAKARAFAIYDGLLPEIISRFKYRGLSRLARPLGDLLGDYEDSEFSFRDYGLVVPVPLHPRRLRQRGFNQSLLLAGRIARRHSLPLDFNGLRRIRATPPQTELSAAERRRNVRGAFSVATPRAFRGKKVLLVDDVFTTGATVEECAKVLSGAGAEQVDVLTLARAR
jgi:ComF family protein